VIMHLSELIPVKNNVACIRVPRRCCWLRVIIPAGAFRTQLGVPFALLATPRLADEFRTIVYPDGLRKSPLLPQPLKDRPYPVPNEVGVDPYGQIITGRAIE
jgi:hypothetical protein